MLKLYIDSGLPAALQLSQHLQHNICGLRALEDIVSQLVTLQGPEN